MTKPLHPLGALIEEVAAKWLPQLDAEWKHALKRWEVAGRPEHDPGTMVIGGWGADLERPPVHNPLKAAMERARQRLAEACRQKLVAGEWIATANKHNRLSAREEIEGDFFLDARIAFDGTGYASAGRGKSKVEIFAMRVRRAVDLTHQVGTAGTQSSVAEVVPARPVLPEPTYTPRSFSAEKVPDQFMDWAKKERALGHTITQGKAMAEMGKVFGSWPNGPGQKTVIAWCKTLDPKWTATAGTPPGRRRN